MDRTLAGLAAQAAPGPGIEVIVVGQDRFGRVPRNGPVRFLETEERCSPARARNLGIAAAQGESLLFVDADCRPHRGWYTTLSAALRQAPVAGGAITFPFDGSRWALADNIASFHELLGDRAAEAASERPLGSLNLAARREAFEQVGPFDEELTTSEDLDWVLRARRAGLATAFVPSAVVEHAAVRADRAALEAHARWYGHHFHAFCRRHPGLLDRGPTWASRRRFALAAPVKAVVSALEIFLRHRRLWRAARALPGVVLFKRAWYGEVLATWHERDEGRLA